MPPPYEEPLEVKFMVHAGKFVILLGAVLILVGLMITAFERVPFIGKLPGDIQFRRGNFTFYFPLATSVVLSVVLTFLFWLFAWLGRR